MTWVSSEEEACSLARAHLLSMDRSKREAIHKDLVKHVHPYRNWTWDEAGWITHLGVTAVTTYRDEHLESNLKLAQVSEMLDLGPEIYCVIDTELPDFEERLFRILEFLPARKICLYPPRTHLGGPFTQPPWNTIGRMICERDSQSENEMVQTAHATQERENCLGKEEAWWGW